MKDFVRARVEYILHKHFLINENLELASYKKLNHLDLNTMEQLEFIWYLENEFEIGLDDMEAMSIQTIGDAVNAITSQLNRLHSFVAA